MKLQIKYNVLDIAHALDIAKKTAEFADILEIGSLLIFQHGVQAVTNFKEKFPEKEIYVDTKIANKAEKTVKIFSQAGATYISVLAGTYHSVTREAVRSAKEENTQIVLDLIDAISPGELASHAQMLGVSTLLFHRAQTPNGTIETESNWDIVRDNTKLPIFVKGKINRETINDIMLLKPTGVVIGSAITESNDPAQEAHYFNALIKK